MKKFLFTLAALLMAGSLCAEEYLYIDDFEVSQSQLGTEIEVTVKAHFEAMVSSWQLDLVVPEGLTPVYYEKGADMTITYLNQRGRSASVTASLGDGQEMTRFISMTSATDKEYDYIDGELVDCGAIKWQPGEYEEMFFLSFEVAADFQGGDLVLKTQPSCGSDPRGNTCELGMVYEKVCHITVEGGEQPIEVTDAPNISWTVDEDAQTVTVTATGNGHICLYNDDVLVAEGEGEATFVVPFTEDPEGEEMGFSATAQEQGKEVSDYALATVEIPGKPAPVVTPTPEIIITPDPDNMGYTIEVVGEGELHLYINGEEVENPYHIDRTDEAQTLVITATAQIEDMEISATAEQSFVVPAFTGEGIYIVLIDQEGNEHQYDLYPSANNPNNYVTMVTLEYNPWGAFDPYYEERPNVPFYFIVNGEHLGAEADMTPTAMGEMEQTVQNPLIASNFCYTVPVGYTYTIGIQITANGDMYVLCAQGPRVGVDELNADKAVAGVRYFNMAGQEMQEVNGATIVVTTYTDGTTSAVKVIK